MGSSSTIGIIANPASARDIRRIVAHGGATTTHDKLNRLQRVMAGLGATGVERVISMADRAGLMAGLGSLAQRPSAAAWPTLEFVDQAITHTAKDTTNATRAMVSAGVGCIVVLGGDGTNRVVSLDSADTPLVSLSTGTNNAFPTPNEATIAGMAAGLVARDDRCRRAGTYRAKRLEVRCGDRFDAAVVDVAVSDHDAVGAGALWDVAGVSDVFLCFAEPGSIGLSAIGSHSEPTPRRGRTGLHVTLSPGATTQVLAPIGPGLVVTVGIESATRLEPLQPVRPKIESGVVAIDGERMFRFRAADALTITLSPGGPVVVDVAATLEFASKNGLLTTTAPTSGSDPLDATEATSKANRTKEETDTWEVST